MSALVMRGMLVLVALSGAAWADIFVSSFSGNTVKRYSSVDGSFIGTFVSAGSGGLSAPHRGYFGPDGNFYVASANNDTILRYNGNTGAFMDIFIQNGAKGLPAGTLDYPVDMTIGPDGLLYVSSQLNDSILRFNASTGQFVDVFVASGSGGLDGPSGIEFHNGDLFVSGRFSNAAYRYDGTTGTYELTIGAGVVSPAYGLTFGLDGNLYVASGSTNQVVRFDPTSGANLGNFLATGSGLSGAIGVEFGPDNNLYVASLNTNEVKRYNGATGASLGTFVAPARMAPRTRISLRLPCRSRAARRW
jgi:streptogramin lyase